MVRRRRAHESAAGFFDESNILPWDTRIWYRRSPDLREALYSWVPPEFLQPARTGEFVNPGPCIQRRERSHGVIWKCQPMTPVFRLYLNRRTRPTTSMRRHITRRSGHNLDLADSRCNNKIAGVRSPALDRQDRQLRGSDRQGALEELGVIALSQAWEWMARLGGRPDRSCTDIAARRRRILVDRRMGRAAGSNLGGVQACGGRPATCLPRSSEPVRPR